MGNNNNTKSKYGASIRCVNHMHGVISNQFIEFHEPHDALIYIITGVECCIADGVGPNKIGDASEVEHTLLR